MRTNGGRSEKGIALLLSLLALLLLSAVAVSMMYMSGTEASINNNFKNEETEYFAARAGVEEVRDRMIPGASPYSLNAINVPIGGVQTCPIAAQCVLPAALPAAGNASVLYILQRANPATGTPAVTMADVTTFGANNNCPAANRNGCLADDELCHDYTIGAMGQSGQPNVRCAGLPAGTAWYRTPAAPAAGTPYASAAPYALDWKWTRVTLKENGSSSYLVDNAQPAANLVCWNGTSEVVAPAGTAISPFNNSPCGNLAAYSNPVYLVTSLAVSPTGARRVVQEELAQTPPGSQPGGLYAVGTGCASLAIAGGAKTYSFNSATEAGGPTNPPSNVLNTGGNVGSNGNVDVSGGGTTVQGSTLTNLPPTLGNCNQGNGVSGNGNAGNINNIPTFPTPYSPTAPPFPTNPVPPVGNTRWVGGPQSPGTYGDVKISGNVTLAAGTYTMNSLSIGAGGQITINPGTGPVIININYQGNGVAVNLGGNGFANNTAVASNLIINYGGPGTVQAQGGLAAYAVINAPNTTVKLTGGSNFYGQVLGGTIDDSGGTNFYWDVAANAHPLNTNPFFEISMRELSY